MNKVELLIQADIGYDSISLPAKITIPIPEGKFGNFSYKQHDTDPLSVEELKIQHAGSNRIKVSMRGTGRLFIETLPDLKIGGSTLEIEGGLAVKKMMLCLQQPKIKSLDVPNVPDTLDKLLRHIVTKFVLEKLKEVIAWDFQEPLENAREQINRPIPFKIKLDQAVLHYEFRAGLETIAPDLKISPDGIHLQFAMTLKPAIAQVE